VATTPLSSGNAQSSSSITTPCNAGQRGFDFDQVQDDRLVGRNIAPEAMRKEEGITDLPGAR